MRSLLIALAIEAACFGLSAFSKFAIDPDMHLPDKRWRRKYVFQAWLKFAAVVAVTMIVWWYWHPIANFLGQDWKAVIKEKRP